MTATPTSRRQLLALLRGALGLRSCRCTHPLRAQDGADTTRDHPAAGRRRRVARASSRRAARCAASCARAATATGRRPPRTSTCAGARRRKVPMLARELKTVLDRKLWVDIDGLSPAIEGNTKDAELQNRDLVGAFTKWNGDWVKVLVERAARRGRVARVEDRAHHGAADSGAVDRVRRRPARREAAAGLLRHPLLRRPGSGSGSRCCS